MNKKHIYIIDRFEGEWAVIEDSSRATFQLPRILIPPEAKEGDVLTIKINLEPELTRKIKDEVQQMMDDIFKD